MDTDILTTVLKFVLKYLLEHLPLGTKIPGQAVEELAEIVADFTDGELSNQKQLELMGRIDDLMRTYRLTRSV